MNSDFKERDWNRLLVEIQEGQVLPVVGPELITAEVNGRKMELNSFMADQLQKSLDVDAGEDAGFTQIAETYLKEGGELHDLYFEISQICKSLDFPIPESVKKLVKISAFTFFISVTVDSVLRNAVNQFRYNDRSEARIYSHSSRADFQDIPLRQGSETSIYKIFGKAGIAPDYVLTEEDLLEHVQRLRDTSIRPENLFDLLSSKRLLQLGCNFPNWLERFFVNGLKNGHPCEGGRTVIADSSSLNDDSLSGFFRRNRVQIYKGDSHEFVDELYRRWQEFCPEGSESSKVEKSDFESGAVFISYASEDKEAAENLRKDMENAGIQVWLDRKELEAGDDYRLKIFRNIENSSFFLPLISKNTLTMDRRFFRLEWNKAQDEAAFRPEGFPFIQPVVIDDTDSSHELIPEYFKAKTHISRFSSGHPDKEFLDLCRKRIRELRRRERV